MENLNCVIDYYNIIAKQSTAIVEHIDTMLNDGVHNELKRWLPTTMQAREDLTKLVQRCDVVHPLQSFYGLMIPTKIYSDFIRYASAAQKDLADTRGYILNGGIKVPHQNKALAAKHLEVMEYFILLQITFCSKAIFVDLLDNESNYKIPYQGHQML